jgi:hypothetical protein
VLNSDPSEPDGIRATSRQAQWLQRQLEASTAPWKIVYFHHAAYSSGSHGSDVALRWPFAAWGASAVLTGHDHHYERVVAEGLLYFVNGLGGRSTYSLSTPIAGSQLRYNADYGAQLIEASADTLSFRFFTRSGRLIDGYTLRKGLPLEPVLQPVVPTPVRETARVLFSIPVAETVQVRVLDRAGREVARLHDGPLPAGHHELLWSRGALASGLYFVQLKVGTFAPAKRTVVL